MGHFFLDIRYKHHDATGGELVTSPRRGRPRKTTEPGQQGLKPAGLPKQGRPKRKLIRERDTGINETEVLSPVSKTRGRPLKRRAEAEDESSGERIAARVLRARDPNLPKSPIGSEVSRFFFCQGTYKMSKMACRILYCVPKKK